MSKPALLCGRRGMMNYLSATKKSIGALLCLAAVTSYLGGCSSSISRFDYPVFGLNDSGGKTTAAIKPSPPEPVYLEPGAADPTYSREPDYSSGYSENRVPSPLRMAVLDPRRTIRDEIERRPLNQPVRPEVTKSTAYDDRPASRAPIDSEGQIVVQPSDTLYNISKRYGVTITELQQANGIEGTDIKVGQKLNVRPGHQVFQQKKDPPGGAARITAREPPPSAKPNAHTIRKPARSIIRERKIASVDQRRPLSKTKEQVAIPVSKPNPRKIESMSDLPVPAQRLRSRFRWPVRGRIISKFGPKPSGQHNDGINLAVPLGTSVKAVENGVVAYAGNELKGYGNLILIRHADNWVSAYAHNSKILVKRGDKISRGQIVGKAGKSGAVNQPQLHFELRKGSKPIDPLKYMARS